MKLNEDNAKFAIVKTAFHGGGTASFHNSLDAAIKARRKIKNPNCTCGCCAIVPITEEARREMIKNGYDPIYLYDEIPFYTANGEHYGKICR